MAERQYFPINETMARQAKEMMSHDDYREGSKTAGYRAAADEAYDLAEQIEQERPKEAERAWRLATAYARRMAANINNDLRIGCMCPSVLVSGAGNFPVKKKEKQVAAWDRNMQEYQQIQGYLDKLRGILHGKSVIRGDDEDAIIRLEEKLSTLEEAQAHMKEVNAYYRKHKTLEGCPELSEKERKEVERSMATGWNHDAPFPSWALSNNNQNIHNTRDRLESLRKAKSRETTDTDYSEYGFTFEENVEDMRFRFFFEGKPDEETRNLLKSNAFKWSPKSGCWQRQITDNARYAVSRVIEKLKEMGGAENAG